MERQVLRTRRGRVFRQRQPVRQRRHLRQRGGRLQVHLRQRLRGGKLRDQRRRLRIQVIFYFLNIFSKTFCLKGPIL